MTHLSVTRMNPCLINWSSELRSFETSAFLVSRNEKFSRIVWSRRPVAEASGTLVQTAETYAIGTFTPLLKKFSFLREVDNGHWDFILTIAGVFIAVTRLGNLGLGENRQRKLMGKVGVKLIQWNPTNGRRYFEDCASFFERTFDALTSAGGEPRYVASDALGSWVVWNVLGRPPDSEEERKLVRTVGGMITHTFSNWWEEKA
jgi:hypothetical protein